MPALAIFVKIKIFTPLDQIVNFIVKVFIVDVFELLIIEWIIIEGL